MAGHVLMPTTGTNNRCPELCYRPGDAVPFTTAEYDVDIDHLIADDSVPVQVAALAPLVPRLPKGRVVLAVQATLLLGRCRGLAVGVTVHHTTCDGAGSTHFLHTWATTAGADEQHRRQLPPPSALAVCANKADGAAFTATPARGRRNSLRWHACACATTSKADGAAFATPPARGRRGSWRWHACADDERGSAVMTHMDGERLVATSADDALSCSERG